MDKGAVFAASERMRHQVADLLAGLDAGQLRTPSLCVGWDVKTVAAHLAVATGPMQTFLGAVVRARGDLHRANDVSARKVARLPTGDIVEALHAQAGTQASPPLVGPRGPLTDAIVHAGDMRIPLGIEHHAEDDAVRTALEFVTTGRPIGFVPKGRLEGLRLVAEDLGWEHGQGDTINGQGLDLLMAVCGRSVVLPKLGGDGVDALAARL